MKDDLDAQYAAKQAVMADGPFARPSDMIPEHVNVRLPGHTDWHLLRVAEVDALAADLSAAVASAAGRLPFTNGWNVEASESAAATLHRKHAESLQVKLREVEAERDALQRIIQRSGP